MERWKAKDPIPRLESYLYEQGILDQERIDAVQQSVEEEVADAIETAESFERPEPAQIFAHVYEGMPKRLEQQMQYLEQLRERHGDEELLE